MQLLSIFFFWLVEKAEQNVPANHNYVFQNQHIHEIAFHLSSQDLLSLQS